MTVVRTRVAGFNHHRGAADRLAKLWDGAQLGLKPQPDNPHDVNAVAVTSNGHMLGFVPKDISAKVAKLVRHRDYHVWAYKTADTFNSFNIEWVGGDPLA